MTSTLFLILLLISTSWAAYTCSQTECIIYAGAPSLGNGPDCGGDPRSPCNSGTDIATQINQVAGRFPGLQIKVVFQQTANGLDENNRIQFCNVVLGGGKILFEGNLASSVIVPGSSDLLKSKGSYLQTGNRCKFGLQLAPDSEFSMNGIILTYSANTFLTTNDGKYSIDLVNIAVLYNTITSDYGLFTIVGESNIKVSNSYFISNLVANDIRESQDYIKKAIDNSGGFNLQSLIVSSFKFPSNLNDLAIPLVETNNNGLIFSFLGASSSLLIDSTLFQDNIGNNGVVVYSSSDFSNISISSSEFIQIQSANGGCFGFTNSFSFSSRDVFISDISSKSCSFLFTENPVYSPYILIENSRFAGRLSSTLIRVQGEAGNFMANNVSFENCLAYDDAGCISVEGFSLIRMNDITAFSYQSSKNGGFLSASNIQEITILESEFLGDSKGALYGGSLYFENVQSAVINSSLFSNHGFDLCNQGGVLFSSGSRIYIANSKFLGNKCQSGNGGSIFSTGYSEISIHKTSFAFGSSQSGGYIYSSSSGILNISYSNFSDSSVLYSGGCICIDSPSSLNVNSSNFIRCGAIQTGGAFSITSDVYTVILYSTFLNNTSNEIGGDIYFENDQFQLQIWMTRFESSFARKGAGSIFMASGIQTINPVRISSCYFKNCSSSDGACIQAYTGSITVSDTMFFDSVSSGSIITLDSSMPNQQIFELINVTMYNCSSVKSDSPITSRKDSLIQIMRSNFSWCQSFSLNSASVIIAYIVDISNSSFNYNSGLSSSANRGCIYLLKSLNPSSIKNSVFISNSIKSGFCSAICSDSTISISQSIFNNNSVLDRNLNYGSTLMINSDSIISNSQFSNDKGNVGSSIYISNSIVLIERCNFSQSFARVKGGSIYISRSSEIFIRNSYFNFTKSVLGGALYADDDSMVNISTSSFLNSESDFGGSIYWNSDGYLRILSSAFWKNTAKSGGSLFISLVSIGNVTITESEFTQNFALKEDESICRSYIGSGGAIFVQSSFINLQMDRNAFDGNRAAKFGGAIGFSDKLVAFDPEKTNSIFSNNVARYGINYGSLFMKQDIYPSNGYFQESILKTPFSIDLIFRDAFDQIVTGLSNCKIRISYEFNFTHYSVSLLPNRFLLMQALLSQRVSQILLLCQFDLQYQNLISARKKYLAQLSLLTISYSLQMMWIHILKQILKSQCVLTKKFWYKLRIR